MKKLAVLLSVVLLAAGMPVAAFGEPLNEASSGVTPYQEITTGLGGTYDIDAAEDGIYRCSKANLEQDGVTCGTLTSLEMIVKEAGTVANSLRLGVTPLRATEASQPYAVDASKTVLNAVAFAVGFSFDGTPIAVPPSGGSIKYTYTASQSYIDDLAKENGIKPSDIKLFVYEKDTNGTIQKLVSNASAAGPVQVSTSDLRSGTFVMALACDTSLLNKSQSRSGSSSETFVGIDPVDMPSVAAGEDESDLSPKTGQALPAGTAPAALLVAGVLGGAAVIAARRRSMR